MNFNSPPPRQTPPPQQIQNFQSPPPPATPGSSQNSQPSIISISSTSPYQSASGLPFETPNVQTYYVQPGGRGTPQQAQVIVSQVQQTPEAAGRGGRKVATPKARACGGRKTPHNVQVNGGEKEDDGEVMIVADKGIPGPGKRSLSRGQRLDRKLSEGSELNPEEQRMLKTRENERKRRQTQKESADRLRDLVGLNDGKSRKVGEGVVMFKSVEFIESLLTQLKQREAEVAALRTEVAKHREFPQGEMVRCLVENGTRHHRLYSMLKPRIPKLDEANAKKITSLAPDFECLPKPYKDKICKEIRLRCAENVNPNSGFVPIEGYAQGGQRQMLIRLPQNNQIRVSTGVRGVPLGRFVAAFRPIPGPFAGKSAVNIDVNGVKCVVYRQVLGEGEAWFVKFRDSDIRPISKGDVCKLFGGQGMVLREEGGVVKVYQFGGVVASPQGGQVQGTPVRGQILGTPVQGQVQGAPVQGQVRGTPVQGPTQAQIQGQSQETEIANRMSLVSLKRVDSNEVQVGNRVFKVAGLGSGVRVVAPAIEAGPSNVDLSTVKQEVFDEEVEAGAGSIPINRIKQEIEDEDEDEEMAGDDQQNVNGPRIDDIKQEVDVEPNLNTVKQEIDEQEMDLEGIKQEPELPKLPLPGFKFSILKDQPGNNDDDDDDDDTFGGGACGIVCENSPGNRVRMGSRSSIERAWDQGRDLGDVDEERAERYMSDVEKEVRMLTVEDLAYHDRVFREHPLFRFDFIWRGMDEETFKGRVEEIVDECWGETVVEVEKLKRKHAEEYKRLKLEEEEKMEPDGDEEWNRGRRRSKRGRGKGKRTYQKKKK